MDLHKQAQHALAGLASGAGRQTLRVQDGNQAHSCELTVEIEHLDALAVQFTDISLATDALAGKSTDELKALADKLSQRLTYLLEPISPIETDPDGATVQLRSNPPQKDEDGTHYYELLVRRGGELHLRRYQKQPGDVRQSIPASLTREVLLRLVADFAAVV